ncbi:uncharacterized protein LOC128209444 isoform X2 [Mya arenaria]|uniref:uncharacterized protein LOC128209444 isoform X2 n=1 Tax=Mya arenaria TaxID=6604 RepID=UPI0022E2D49E|nr:uncharacterized protein LOC128209444 isoform X2 [Mya arenaria]
MKININVFLCVFALLDVCIFVEGHHFYVSDQKTQWGKSNCSLALPSFNYTDHGIFAETEHTANLSFPDEGLWVGLFQANLSFAYVGCNAMNNSGVDIVHNISECRWKSQCNTFAIRETDNEKIECKCFDLGDIARETECTSTCKSTDEYTCGRKGQNYFSVYTVENVSISKCFSTSASESNCLGYYNQIFAWISCTTAWKKSIFCSDQPYYATDANISVADPDSKSWAKGGKTCFERNEYPAAFKHVNSSEKPSGPVRWTGVIRMSSLLRFDEMYTICEPKQYAYVTLDDMTLEVRFEDKVSVNRKSLCETPDTITTTITSTDVHLTSTSKRFEMMTKDKAERADTTTKTITSTENLTSTTKRLEMITKDKAERADTTTKTITSTENLTSTSKRLEMITKDKAERVEPQIPITEISAGVSTAVVLVILVVMIIILWKRGGLRRFGGDTKTPPNNETPMQYLDTEYTEPQARDHPKAYPNQGYSMNEELPMSTKNITSGKPQILDEYEDVNDLSNTKINPQGIQLNIGNVHNNINRDIEEYDHLNHSGILDHAISQPINDYDSATAAIGENQEDTYNHLNERPKQRRITENDYGVQDKNETKDIYNKLNERPEQKHMMENIYGMQDKNETENEYDISVERPVMFKDMSEKASGVNYDKVNKNW